MAESLHPLIREINALVLKTFPPMRRFNTTLNGRFFYRGDHTGAQPSIFLDERELTPGWHADDGSTIGWAALRTQLGREIAPSDAIGTALLQSFDAFFTAQAELKASKEGS